MKRLNEILPLTTFVLISVILVYLVTNNSVFKPTETDVEVTTIEKQFCCDSCGSSSNGSGKVTCGGCKAGDVCGSGKTWVETGSAAYSFKDGELKIY